MKIAVLWTKLSGYLNASLQALAGDSHVEIFVANEVTTQDAPFADEYFRWIRNRYEYEGRPNKNVLLSKLDSFKPDIIICCWHIPEFQQAARHFKGRSGRVACLDSQWRGTLRQRVAAATSSWHLLQCYDATFVPGERQATWARKMGFPEVRIWRGLFSCDSRRFNGVACNAGTQDRFVYVGRTSPEKGVETLVHAYERYRNQSSSPWPLVISGAGPLDSILTATGIEHKGFTQPEDLPNLLSRMGCLVLASTSEGWGVAIHEAATAGLPIICSRECGASVHLVQDGYNGFLVEAKDVPGLANVLMKFANLSRERRMQMGEASMNLAQQYSPERWATCVLEKGEELLQQIRMEQVS